MTWTDALVASRNSAAIAITSEATDVTYNELFERASKLAGTLKAWGAGPGVVIPLQMSPSVEAIISISAISLTGASFAPIDLRVPDETVARIVRLVGWPHVLSHASRDNAGIRWQEPSSLDKEVPPASTPKLAVDANCAYVIFTSGTSGFPKGVVVQHRGLDAYLRWSMKEYEITEGLGAPLFTSLGFDLSVTSLIGPLSHGRRVRVLDPIQWPITLADDLDSCNEESFIKLTPSQLNFWCDMLRESPRRSRLRRLVVGGEAMYGEAVQAWREFFPATEIVNEYGPTEATVACCRFVVPDDFRGDAVPIGLPPEGVRLDIESTETPRDSQVAESGELIIRGQQVASGYLLYQDPIAPIDANFESGAAWSRPTLEAFEEDQGERTYRSGDSVTTDKSGNYVYIGRLGREVKTAGFRVNLAAIEARIQTFPGVRGASVSLDPDDSISAIVYGPSSITPQDLKAYLLNVFPPYAIPEKIALTQRVAMTERGKIQLELES